jgi:hypothetical protein
MMAEAVIYLDTSESSQGAPTDMKRSESGGRPPEIVLCQDRNFYGQEFRTNFGYSSLGDWNDRTSSFVIISGVWEFYKDDNFQGGRLGNGSQQFGIGYYAWVEDVGIPNDSISSFKYVSW